MNVSILAKVQDTDKRKMIMILLQELEKEKNQERLLRFYKDMLKMQENDRKT